MFNPGYSSVFTHINYYVRFIIYERTVHYLTSKYFYLLSRGICNQAPVHCIVMEFCPNGQLYEVLRNGRQITPSLLVKWSKQIADGMHYLHVHKIIHRDLKSPK